MVHSRSTDETQKKDSATLAKPLAPEEIRAGDYVSPLYVIYEVPSFFWCCDSNLQRRDELVRLCCLPQAGGAPLKVISVCLPFVLVKLPGGERQSLDVRKVRLARLDARLCQACLENSQEKEIGGCDSPIDKSAFRLLPSF